MKTLPEWLSEMERLDKEATKGACAVRSISMAGPKQALLEIGCNLGPANGPIRSIQLPEGDANFYMCARTELPRAVRIIKFLLNEAASWKAHALSDTGDWYETREMLIENYDAHLKKILNEDGGEG